MRSLSRWELWWRLCWIVFDNYNYSNDHLQFTMFTIEINWQPWNATRTNTKQCLRRRARTDCRVVRYCRSYSTTLLLVVAYSSYACVQWSNWKRIGIIEFTTGADHQIKVKQTRRKRGGKVTWSEYQPKLLPSMLMITNSLTFEMSAKLLHSVTQSYWTAKPIQRGNNIQHPKSNPFNGNMKLWTGA